MNLKTDAKLEISDNLATLSSINDLLERRFYIYGVIPDVNDYRNYYTLDFTALSVPDIVRFIIAINREDNKHEAEAAPGETFERKPIWIYIDSFGGDIDTRMSLVNTISLSKTPVYTVNLGLCYSMAFVIFISGHRRFSLPDAKFLFHDGHKVCMGDANKVDDYMNFSKRYEKAVFRRIMLERSNDTFTEEIYERLYPHDNYLFAKEALGYGFVDEIIEDISILG
ncbi:ATP-dependent Clp protease proteolytic subunit [Candidatus Saccharibacteria bacterium]|nr:ATP-dependent Clp protease proteolytic subunit [Candidatus Saccharibacteria bacterium]